ncbi:MAG: hypothetical protein EA361_09200 [Bacteroidetes bacterium]|nr:MAG: hypothetical protein EA361_09200 [Bacteroidota bacterium]
MAHYYSKKKVPGWFSMLFILLLLFCLLSALPAGAQPYNVGQFQQTFIDPDRNNRAILTEVYFPADENGNLVEGEFPLLVFGHGFVMTWSAYQNLWEYFVPRGYVMAFPRTESGFSPSHQNFGLDIAFLADAINELSDDPGSALFQGLNGKVAAMGHSMGGGAAVLAASYNPNITALLTLAPAETSPSAIAAAENVTIPSLIFSGSSDDVTPENTNQAPVFNALNSQAKTWISITGGGHCYFANYNFNCAFGESFSSGNITISRQEQQQATADFSILWLNYFLRDDCAALTVFQDSLQLSPRIAYQQEQDIDVPVVTREGDQLLGSPAATWQWYFDGEPVTGADQQFFQPQQSGTYQVEVTYFNLCKYISEPFEFLMEYSISIATEPSGSGEVFIVPEPPWLEGTFIELQAMANDGFTFLHWKENGEVVSAFPQYSFVIDRDRNLTAGFEPAVQSFQLRLSVMLEGAWLPNGNGQMHTSLRDGGFIPLQQPFGVELPWFGNPLPLWHYTGDEVVETILPNVVDWVLVELRDAPAADLATSHTSVARRAALLLNNGNVVCTNYENLNFDISVASQLFVVVYHRNHVSIISSGALSNNDGVYQWNFMAGPEQAYLQGQKHLGNNFYGMFGGDGDGNGQIQTQDKNEVWNQQAGQSGYLPGDFDLNGQVQTQDKNNIWNPNSGVATQVP